MPVFPLTLQMNGLRSDEDFEGAGKGVVRGSEGLPSPGDAGLCSTDSLTVVIS